MNVDSVALLGIFVAAQAVLLSLVLLLVPSRNPLANRFLSAFILLMGLRFVTYFTYLSDLPAPSASYFIPIVCILMAPAIYLYVLALSQPGFRLEPRLAVHLWPLAALTLVVVLVVTFLGDRGAEIGPYLGDRVPREIPVIVALFSVVSIGYTAAALRLIRTHHERLEAHLSSIDSGIDLRWLRILLTLVLLLFSAHLVLDMLRIVGALEYRGRATVDMLSSLGIILFVAVGGLRQSWFAIPRISESKGESHRTEAPTPATPEPPDESGPDLDKYGLDDPSAAALWDDLQSFMSEHRPHLDNSLSLTALAEQISLSPQVVSAVINSRGGESFYDYVNGFRVETAKELLADPAQAEFSLLDLAHEAGFNSQSAFYKHFKKRVGETPKQFRLRMLETAPA